MSHPLLCVSEWFQFRVFSSVSDSQRCSSLARSFCSCPHTVRLRALFVCICSVILLRTPQALFVLRLSARVTAAIPSSSFGFAPFWFYCSSRFCSLVPVLQRRGVSHWFFAFDCSALPFSLRCVIWFALSLFLFIVAPHLAETVLITRVRHCFSFWIVRVFIWACRRTFHVSFAL